MGSRPRLFAAVTVFAVTAVAAPLLYAAPAAVAAGSAVPSGGSALVSIHPAEVAGARPLGAGAWAIPLRAARPHWLTDDLLAAAARGPTAVPAAAIVPDAPLSGYVGIRPGSEMVAPYGCTMNFVFGNGTDLAIGTAGHCADKVGQAVTLLTIAPGSPPRPENLVLVTIGNVISRADSGVGSDFALVDVKPELEPWVLSTTPVVGGPCGKYTGSGLARVPVPRLSRGQVATAGPETVEHYGHGLGIGTGGTARSGVALYWNRDAYYWTSPGIFGDSGSPVRVTNLQAAGDLTHLVVEFPPKHPGAVVAGTRISKMESLAKGYTLVSSPYCA